MNNRLYIKEDITDWRDKVLKDETVIKTEADIVEQLAGGTSSPDVSRAVLVSREMGEAPSDIIQQNKVLLTFGAMSEVSRILKKNTIEVEGKNGKTYEAPAFVGRIGRPALETDDETKEKPEDKGPSYVKSQSVMALNRAESYMTDVVPGHIWNRLLLIKANGGDPKQAVTQLIDSMEQMLERL